MAYEYDDEFEEEGYPDAGPNRPRFGPFVTIAVAILMLFGAASRVGKDNENVSWSDFDFFAGKNLEEERLRKQEEVAKTLITLGTAPTPAHNGSPANRASIVEPALPPSRVESMRPPEHFSYQDPELSARAVRPPESRPGTGSGPRGLRPDNGVAPQYLDPVPEATPAPRHNSGGVYVVAAGDNWVKIGNRTGKKWQDIQNANPESRNGLRVGMRLKIP